MLRIDHGPDAAEPAAAKPGQTPLAEATPTAAERGLVTSAKTVREFERGWADSLDQGIRDLWQPGWPTPDDVADAAAAYVGETRWDGREGPRPRLIIGAGALRLTAPDAARRARAEEREVRRRQVDAEMAVAWRESTGDWPKDPEPQREIREWSRASRSNMVYKLAVLDWTPILTERRTPAMTTLTYPGDWETVAPDGRTSKKHLTQFFKRYERAWGTPWVGAWKLEFQARGAPHYHLYSVPPAGLAGEHRRIQYLAELEAWKAAKAKGRAAGRKPYYRDAPGDGLPYRQWLSVVWADIVAHPDPGERERHRRAGTAVDYAEGMRASDPKRLASYFAKHGTYSAKDYQHRVPLAWQAPGRGPGRFWGYRGLQPRTAEVEISWAEYQLLARTMRRMAARTRVWDPTLSDGRGGYRWVKALRRATVPRGPEVAPETGEVRYRRRRWVRRPVRRMAQTSGYLCANDGPALARELARLRAACLDPVDRGQELLRAERRARWALLE